MIVLTQEAAIALLNFVGPQIAPLNAALQAMQQQLNTPEGAAPQLAQEPDQKA